MNAIETILVTISISGSTTAAIAWLAKSLLSQWLAKDIENHKLRLTMAAHEHQICFASLHQKQADVIAECYQRFLEANACIQKISNSDAKNFNDEERRLGEVAVERCLAGMIVFHNNQLYFPDELQKRLMNLSVHVFKYTLLYSGIAEMMGKLSAKHGSNERTQMMQEALRGGWKNVQSEVPMLLDELKIEFRRLLGIQK
jgi:hypothetical protein